MRPMSNRALQSTYRYLNERFFDGRIKLPASRVKFGDTEECDGVDTEGITYPDEIFISEYFQTHPDMATLVLLHEMVHADLQQEGYIGYKSDHSHGTRFKAGIDRLYRAGAYDGLL